MPLLKREADIHHPQTLFERPPTELPWWVAHVRSRQEKRLARLLLLRDVPFFLPHREKRTRRAGRSFVSYSPLFPGYVFFRGAERERLEALSSRVVVRFLPVEDPTLLQAELLQLRRLQLSGAELEPVDEIALGDAVRVVDGPFRGNTGIVLREPGRARLVVSISMLRRSVAVELDRRDVSRLSGHVRGAESGTRGVAA